ncbi:YdeI family protein [Streptomyces sp. NPDC058620]|uniref:YdeI/OmpD-associated family protein n=1 Tax=Streptomyces sp. NPDC058620 TaxID=3346560 RepID=UPI00364BE15C
MQTEAAETTAPETLFFARAADLESWLDGHHGTRTALWIKIAKKASGVASVTAAEVIENAICYGWIDGQRKSYDGTYYLQKITPRRPRSTWSLVNVRKVEALTADGRMREPGLAEVRAARADGRWAAAYPSQSEAVVPADLEAALAGSAEAARHFEQLGKSARYLVILRLATARTPAVRSARLRRMTERLAAGEPIR